MFCSIFFLYAVNDLGPSTLKAYCFDTDNYVATPLFVYKHMMQKGATSSGHAAHRFRPHALARMGSTN